MLIVIYLLYVKFSEIIHINRLLDSRNPFSLNKAEKSHLLQGPQVQILGFQDMWQQYLSAFDVPYSTTTSFITVDTTIAAVDIVATGGGCAVVLDRFAKTAIETSRSIEIVGDAIPIQQSHFLVGGQISKPNDAAKKMFEIWVEQIFA